MATAEGTPPAAEVADDSTNAPAIAPPLKDTWTAVPDLEEPPAQDEDEEGHQHHPHDHSHEENNTPDGNGAQPAEKTGSEKTPPNAADADSPGTRARRASNKKAPSEGDDAARKKARRKSSAFALSEAITSDPASVVDHEARQTQWAELFDEALMSYRDVSIAAVVVSWMLVGCCLVRYSAESVGLLTVFGGRTVEGICMAYTGRYHLPPKTTQSIRLLSAGSLVVVHLSY